MFTDARAVWLRAGRSSELLHADCTLVTDARALWLRTYCSDKLLYANCTVQSLMHVPCGCVPTVALSCYLVTVLDSHV